VSDNHTPWVRPPNACPVAGCAWPTRPCPWHEVRPPKKAAKPTTPTREREESTRLDTEQGR
jgi:hypothetical protein